MEKHIWDGYAHWAELARSADLQVLRDKITGLRGRWEPNFMPTDCAALLQTLMAIETERCGQPQTVIDFGCGLGRNAPLLRRFFPRVLAIDLPPMIARLRQDGADFWPQYYTALYDDMGALLAQEQPHCLFESVVFQHITDADYVAALAEQLHGIGRLHTLICLENHDVDAAILQRLRAKGWAVMYRTTDTETFLGAPHDLMILRRPDRALAAEVPRGGADQ